MPSFERPGRFMRRTWADLQLLKSNVRVYIPADGSFNYGGVGGGSALYAIARHIFVPDAAPGVAIVAGDQQGAVLHSGPSGETATKLQVDAETAPGAAGLPITVQYADTNDLDTASVWTTIATLTLSSEKSSSTTTMTTAAIPADRLLRLNVGTIVGAPMDATITLQTKVPLTT